MNALIIKLNNNPMGVVLDDIQFANLYMEALSRQHYNETKHNYISVGSYEDYMRSDASWNIQSIEIATSSNWAMVLNKMQGKIAPATHHPETFPHPGHIRLPNQTQLPRVQKTPAAVTHSDRSDPNPGVAREHRRVSSADTQAREEHQAEQDQQ